MREYLSHSASVKLFFSPRAELVALAPAQIPFSLFSPLDAFHNRVNRINFENVANMRTRKRHLYAQGTGSACPTLPKRTAHARTYSTTVSRSHVTQRYHIYTQLRCSALTAVELQY